MLPVVSLVGKPDCGKTTLLTKLIPELNRLGYRVGTIKHHVHDFEMDKPGKDTWKHKQAGARIVALSSPTGLGIIRDTDRDSAIAELVGRYFHDVDLVITEGYKREAMPKIEVFRSAVHDEPLADRDDTWVAVVSDVPLADNLPHFDPDDVQGLATFLIEQFVTPACLPRATLLVDGAAVELNSFVEKFIARSVTGMTSSLKGCDTPKEITITIRNG